MSRWLVTWPVTAVLVLILAGASLCAPDARAQQAKPPGTPPKPRVRGVLAVLKATPQHGHSGDTIYLSGSGFPPDTHLLLMMACPNWFVGATTYHNVEPYGRGPTTDVNGEFSSYTVRALPLQHLPFSDCQIYTQYGANPFGPDIPASYRILARKQQLGFCDSHICAHVAPSPRRVRSGLVEHISIEQSWPGAIADISITYTGGTTRHISRTLDWSGSAEVTDRVPAKVAVPMRADVKVHFRFGHTAGNAFTNFVVVH